MTVNFFLHFFSHSHSFLRNYTAFLRLVKKVDNHQAILVVGVSNDLVTSNCSSLSGPEGLSHNVKVGVYVIMKHLLKQEPGISSVGGKWSCRNHLDRNGFMRSLKPDTKVKPGTT